MKKIISKEDLRVFKNLGIIKISEEVEYSVPINDLKMNKAQRPELEKKRPFYKKDIFQASWDPISIVPYLKRIKTLGGNSLYVKKQDNKISRKIELSKVFDMVDSFYLHQPDYLKKMDDVYDELEKR